MTSLRRHLFGLAGAAIAAAATSQPTPAHAENIYPLRLIVPCATGTPADLLARHVARTMFDEWGQQVAVENIPTGGGNIGKDSAGEWLADGRTIVLNLGNCGNEDDGWWPSLSKR
jgi:tripartite-type tricarboxylate transporter receptor subunit TctC